MAARREDVAEDIHAVMTPQPTFQITEEDEIQRMMVYTPRMPTTTPRDQSTAFYEPSFTPVTVLVEGEEKECHLSDEVLAIIMMRKRIEAFGKIKNRAVECTKPQVPTAASVCSHHGCGKTGQYQCGSCYSVSYCSRRCQCAHFESCHKKECPCMREAKIVSLVDKYWGRDIARFTAWENDAVKVTQVDGDLLEVNEPVESLSRLRVLADLMLKYKGMIPLLHSSRSNDAVRLFIVSLYGVHACQSPSTTSSVAETISRGLTGLMEEVRFPLEKYNWRMMYPRIALMRLMLKQGRIGGGLKPWHKPSSYQI